MSAGSDEEAAGTELPADVVAAVCLALEECRLGGRPGRMGNTLLFKDLRAACPNVALSNDDLWAVLEKLSDGYNNIMSSREEGEIYFI